MKNIGLNIEQPTTDCDDHHCPFHGQISIRGKLIQAKLIKTKARRTAVLRIEFFHYVKKYMRYEKRRRNIIAHISPCLNVNDNDSVTIGECRPLSKNVSFVVLGRVN